MQHNWECIIYFFSVGGVLFALGLWLPVRMGDVSWSRPEDRRTLLLVVAGMLFYLILYLSWQLYAIGVV